MIKVSVIIPVYNVEAYLEECLDSVINQRLKEIEIICVNDGSTDGSLAILERYAEKDDRIQIITKENAGLGAARNTGVRVAEGEYLLFIDSDDYIALDGCETLYNVAKKNDLDILQGLYIRFRGEKNIKDVFYSSPENMCNTVYNGLEFLKNVTFVSGSNCDKLWKRDFFTSEELYNSEGVYHEDVLTSFKGLVKSARIMIIPFIFYYYRQREGSILNQKLTEKHRKSWAILVQNIGAFCITEKLFNHSFVCEYYLDLLYTFLLDHGKNTETRKQMQNFIQTIKTNIEPSVVLELNLKHRVFYKMMLCYNFIPNVCFVLLQKTYKSFFNNPKKVKS